MNELVFDDTFSSQTTSMGPKNDLTTIQMQRAVDDKVEEVRKKSIPERIPAFGILLTLISLVCFSVCSVIVKVLPEIHTIQLLLFRCLFQFIFNLFITLILKYSFFALSGHRVNLLLRCIFGTITVTTLYMSIRIMPLPDAYTIYYSSPIFVIILAYFLLKEPLTILQGITVILTLIGVVITAKPQFIFGSKSGEVIENRLEGPILAVTASFSTAVTIILMRKLRTLPVAVIVMWYSGFASISGLVFLLILNKFVWPAGLWAWSLSLAIGVFGTAGQYFMTTAFHYESAGPISVARTFSIVISFIWEIVLLSKTIEWTSVIGACLVSSGVIILGLVKWENEKPELFKRISNKFCCCFKRQEKEIKL